MKRGQVNLQLHSLKKMLAVEEFIPENRQVTCVELGRKLGVGLAAMQGRSGWVPHKLNDDQKFRSSQYSRKPVALIERERKIMVDVVLARMCAPTQFSLSP
ncbi:hypothetical protein EVAR_85551_1 [Eumeta japonica]|uniref:Uncharacterized protein n=1 Tax=Eumeta variegata TaxID=151549 RepID=A0A4C1VDE5_EUMVA|nr:hypothetical protein EVAR_85551_1 [Eumeta japonica]